ncbi:MAG: hypothetical protein AAF847_03575 [Bacteroidota bacterium]
MNFSLAKFYLLFGVVSFCLGCDKGNNTTLTNKEVNIDPIFQPYIDEYVKEAAARGVAVPIEEKGLILLFDDLEGINGQCATFSQILADTTAEHRIVIDRGRWENLTEGYKAFLIFHEMGHCYEYRPHTTDTLPNGEWKSLMRDSRTPFGNNILNFSGTRRDYYIDELFNEDVVTPEWTTWERDYELIPEESKTVLVERKNVRTFNQLFDLSGNYEIELEFTITADMAANYLVVGWGNSVITESIYFGFFRRDLLIADFVTDHGVLHRKNEYEQYRIGDTLKLTVQKIGSYFWYFVNEDCVYWSDLIDLPMPRVFLSTSNNIIRADRISVKNLPD